MADEVQVRYILLYLGQGHFILLPSLWSIELTCVMNDSQGTRDRLGFLAKQSDANGTRLREIQTTIDDIRRTLATTAADTTDLKERLCELIEIPDQVWNTVAYERILSALHFPQIDERFQVVPDSHSTTFEWMFSADAFEDLKKKCPEGTGTGSDDYIGSDHYIFYHELTEGERDKIESATSDWIGWLKPSTLLPSKSWHERVFHVSGKLASGKSTLMKFLYQHKATQTELSLVPGKLGHFISPRRPCLAPWAILWETLRDSSDMVEHRRTESCHGSIFSLEPWESSPTLHIWSPARSFA